MLNESIEFDLKVNGKEAKASIEGVEDAQEKLGKTTERTSKSIKTNWTAIGVAAAAAAASIGVMMRESVELERALFGLNEETKEWIKNASEQYGMSQDIIGGFVQTGKAAGMAGEDIAEMVDQAIALGRAYPHESTESFIDNLVMLNRTGEAQGYIVDVLEQKYGLIDLKTLSLEQKQLALKEAIDGVNDEFDKTRAANMDKTFQELANKTTEFGDALWDIAESSGALWAVQKGMLGINLAANGYAQVIAYIKSMGWFGADVDKAEADLKRLAEEAINIRKQLGGQEPEDRPLNLGTIGITAKSDANIVVEASKEADKERAIALAANKRFLDEYNRAISTAYEHELYLLNKQFEEYDKYVTDKSKLNEWYNAEMIKLMETFDEQMNAYRAMGDALTDGLTRGIINFTQEGKANFKDMANSIIQDMLQIQIRSSMMSLFGGFNSSGGGILGGAFNMLFNAKGNAFNDGQVTAFANGGVVDSPTVFPMANGTGLMGEAGPEAIVPLTRTSGGDLGVKATSPIVNVNVENYGNDRVDVQQNGDNISVIISQIASSISRGTGGIGDAIEGRYGIRKQ